MTDMQIGKRRELVDEIGCRVIPGFRIGSVCRNKFQRFELRETGRRSRRRIWVGLGSFESEFESDKVWQFCEFDRLSEVEGVAAVRE